MTTRGDEKQVEEIVADLAELRASLAEQFSALRENLEREFAMLKFVFQPVTRTSRCNEPGSGIHQPAPFGLR